MEKKMKKLKLTDLVKDNPNELVVKQLSEIKGGFNLRDGCYSGVCTNDQSTGGSYCAGAAWCTHGIG